MAEPLPVPRRRNIRRGGEHDRLRALPGRSLLTGSDSPRRGSRRWSRRWWFENRHTGEITIAQFPNWPLWGIAGAWVLRLALPDSSTAHSALGWVIVALWLVWGTDELVRGVNPWRRVLGAGVITWQVTSLLVG